MTYNRPFNNVIRTSVDKLNTALDIELPSKFTDGKYHIKERLNGDKIYLSIQQEDNFFRIDNIPNSITIK